MTEQEKSDYAKREEEVLELWNTQGTFEQSLQKDAPNGDFTFYDGPPFATGLPHYGHLLQSAVKDAVPRYKTMQGFRVNRTWGWDCHGLPIENIVEKELGTKSKKDIEAMGIKKFNDLCREKIFAYAKEWERIIPRFGRWADMKNAYKTMDTAYMEKEWWAFKQLYEKGFIYENYRSMHICPRCETTLSQGEVSEGYKDVKDLSATVVFELTDEPGTYLLAWTTTPWTLPGNVALAVGFDIEYVTIASIATNKKYIVAKERVPSLFALVGDEYVLASESIHITGKDLVGKAYVPLFDFYAKDENLKNKENGWKVYAADFVTTDDGTGIVHIAPAFGTDDMNLGKQHNLPFVQHVAQDGTFKKEAGEYAELDLKPRAKEKFDEPREADITMLRVLAEKGALFAKEKYEHSYPHCWRCDTALLNYATSSWFVAVEKLKPTLLETAQDINWSPAHIKEGRWGQWLVGARDWSISRQRFWANTIPVWRCIAGYRAQGTGHSGCGVEVVVGSIDELEKLSGTRVNDLHKDVVDEITWQCTCGGTMTRVPDVLDTWFDSGSVPFASEGEFKTADFIAEGQDQCRAWFYYQHVLAGGLFGKEAFSNCAVTGIVLAEDGKKMSKKLQNYPDPMYILNTYGADAMRLYMLGSPVVRAESLSFAEKEVGEIARKTIGRLINVYEFYELYRKGTGPSAQGAVSTHVLDQWIIARVRQTHAEVTKAMDAYVLDDAVRPLHQLVDDLSTWYLRRSRERIKNGDADALSVLAWTLKEIAKMFAPFAPFTAEWLWHRVKRGDDPTSVHFATWSAVHTPDTEVLSTMVHARNYVVLGLFARSEAGIKVRQPLQSFTIGAGFEPSPLFSFVKDIIADELNVKEVIVDPTFTKEGQHGGHWWLNTTLTPALIIEGHARDIIRAIQDARKQAGLKPDDVIAVQLAGAPEHEHALSVHQADIAKQTNAQNITFSGHAAALSVTLI